MPTAIVAVAGGFGFLGASVVQSLQHYGYTAVPFSRRTGVDIRDIRQVEKFLDEAKPRVVINCAAHVGGIAYNAMAPVDIYEDNLRIGFNIIKACAERNIAKLVNVMPNCTYPGVAEIYRETEWWDGEMHDTVLTYGMPRKAMWAQAWAYQQKIGFRSIHIVLPNLYGPNDHFDPIRSHALGALIKKIVEAWREQRDRVEIWGTGSPVREWGYVTDAAEGIVRAMEHYDDLAIMNLGQGHGCSIRDLAELIKQAVGWQGTFIFDPSRPDGAPKKILDVSKMRSVLAWSPPTPLRKGIKETIEWYVQYLARESRATL